MNLEIYDEAQAKLCWADQHISTLESAVENLFNSLDSSPIASRHAPEGDTITYFVRELPAIPPTVALIAGDVLHNLHAALDYIAYGLIPAADRPNARNNKFPIAHSAKDFPSLVGKLVPGLGNFAMEALWRLRPYKGGNEYLWHLHRLNNIDKHRLLLTFGFMCVGRSLTADEKLAAKASGRHRPGKSYVVAKRPSDTPIILSPGDELLTVGASEPPVGFRFDVAIREAGIPEGMPLALHLRFIHMEVGMVVREMAYFTQ